MINSKDLSQYHSMVGDLFTWPKKKADWDQYKLSKHQVEFFNENGFVSNIKILDDWQIERLNKELSDIADPNHSGHSLFYEYASNEAIDPNSVLFHALGAWRITAGFHDVLWNPAFIMAASQLLGDKPVRFWHDQLFCKPAYHGGVVAWHQDYSYWTRTKPMQHLTCWVGLDDATKENGCLHYVPNSHRWGLLKKPELAGNMEGLIASLTNQQKKHFKPVAIELEKGYGTFHHPLMVHGSYENKSNRSRRAFVINVFGDGTISDSDTELLEGTGVVPRGSKMSGQFYPLLFNPEVAK